ncbi:MAG: peptidoglycan D,D-transpeptidase FtsI family protein [Phycisphaerae bacterium]
MSADQKPTIDPTAAWQRRCGSILLLLIIATFPLILARLAYINVVKAPELLAKTQRERRSQAVIPARRGEIRDRKGRCLATTRHTADVFIDPKAVKDRDEAIGAVAARLNMKESAIRDAIERRPNSRYIVLAKRVDDVTAAAIEELDMRGVGLERHVRRFYPHDERMSQLLGFVGADGDGMEGIELAYNQHLSGTDGQVSSIRDGYRRALYLGDKGRRAPIDGNHLALTLDLEIQRITEEAVAAQVKAFEAESGIGIVMRPKTGEVLAMANIPTFNLNRPADADKTTRRNRVVTDPVEPGSTFKPFIASGALSHGVLTPYEKIDCEENGVMRMSGRTIRDTHANGMQDITGIITKSSNIGMVKIGQRMGAPLLHQTLLDFGFGQRTGIGLPGESSGVVYPLEKWKSGSAISVSFGYEVMVTPLQLITGFCALVNGGQSVRPSIVAGCETPQGESMTCKLRERERRVRVHTPERTQRVNADTARFISQEAMRSVVENGTIKRHFKGPYTVIGKTGTAKLMKPDRSGYASRSYLGTFMGAGPSKDPELAVVVMIRKPNADKGYYGGTTAAPAVSRILTEALTYLGVRPDRGEPVALGSTR